MPNRGSSTLLCIITGCMQTSSKGYSWGVQVKELEAQVALLQRQLAEAQEAAAEAIAAREAAEKLSPSANEAEEAQVREPVWRHHAHVGTFQNLSTFLWFCIQGSLICWLSTRPMAAWVASSWLGPFDQAKHVSLHIASFFLTASHNITHRSLCGLSGRLGLRCSGAPISDL